ncbi:MAG: DUF5683 domain-containing protein [bacterium]|nr:DUF5683 domain-containing protein [bacterium]
MFIRNNSVLLLLLAATALYAAEPTALPTPLSSALYENQVQVLAQMESGAPAGDTTVAPANNLNMGKAVLLSAILPGAGQFYAGQKWKGYTFMGVEVALWALAISYTMQGNDKDDEFKKFADANWMQLQYRNKEYELAILGTLPNRQSGLSGNPFPGTRVEWDNLPWTGGTGTLHDRSWWLPTNFTHELPGDRDQQYYEMIGKYLTQFGFAWNDQYGDDTTGASVGVWNGVSKNAEKYADMRYDSNQLLKMGNNMFMIVMVNHVASAVEAAMYVKKHNSQGMETSFRLEPKMFGNEMVAMPTLQIRF